MKRLILAFGVVMGAAGVGGAKAADDFATAVAGAYFLIQDDEFQRILSFDQGGNVAQVSDKEASIGFTSGQGTWRRTGEDEVTATIIDFGFNIEDGSPSGPTVLVYVLAFADEVAPGPDDWGRERKFQSLRGTFSGKQYAVGQNPLAPTEPPTREFKNGLTGQRITAQ